MVTVGVRVVYGVRVTAYQHGGTELELELKIKPTQFSMQCCKFHSHCNFFHKALCLRVKLLLNCHMMVVTVKTTLLCGLILPRKKEQKKEICTLSRCIDL